MTRRMQPTVDEIQTSKGKNEASELRITTWDELALA